MLKHVEWWAKNSIKEPLLEYCRVVDVAVAAVKYRERAPIPSPRTTPDEPPCPRPPSPDTARPGSTDVPVFIKESGMLENDRFGENSPLIVALRREGLIVNHPNNVSDALASSKPRSETLRGRLHRLGVRKLSDLRFLRECDLGPLPLCLWEPQNSGAVELENCPSQFQRGKLLKDLLALSTPPNSNLETLSKWLASIHVQEYHELLTSVEAGLGIRAESFINDFE